MFTLNQLISLLRQIASDHYQIQDFGFGSFTEFAGRENKLSPCMWVEPKSSQVEGKELILNFDVFIFDLTYSENQSDRSNTTEVLSDTLQIGLDVISQLTNHSISDYVTIRKSAGLEPVIARSTDIGAGWFFHISCSIAYDYDRCSVPSDFIFAPLSGECEDALIKNSDSTFSQSVKSGSFLILDDITFKINVNGILQETIILPSQINHTINID